MRVKTIPKCLTLRTDTKKPGNVGVCLKDALWGISLAKPDTIGRSHYDACPDCLTYRLSLVSDLIDTAKMVYYTKDK